MHTVPENPRDLDDAELFDRVFCKPGLPLLRLIPMTARAWQVCHPYAGLGGALVNAACGSPLATVFSPVADGAMPLNMLIGLAGKSGSGKGNAMSSRFMRPKPPKTPTTAPTATPATANGQPVVGTSAPHPTAPRINTAPKVRTKGRAASGESLVTFFYDNVSADPADQNSRKRTWVRHYDGVLLKWGEVDQFGAKAGAKGNTLEPALRAAYSGEELGDVSITRLASGMPTTVDENSYRLCIVVGIQPRKAAPVMDGDGGTLQRIVWLPALDEDELDDPAALRAAKRDVFLARGLPVPADLRRCNRPILEIPGPDTDGCIPLSDDVIDDVQRQKAAAGRGDDEDTHGVGTRLRIAAIYAGWKADHLGCPLRVDWEAWEWAGLVMEVSRRTREDVKEVKRQAKIADAHDRGEDQGHQAVARQQVMDKANDAQDVQQEARVIAILSGVPSGLTPAQIDKARGRSVSTRFPIDDILSRLRIDGRVVSAAEKSRNGTIVQRYTVSPADNDDVA